MRQVAIVALALGWAALSSASPPAGSAPTMATLEALYDLRLADPPAFVAGVARLEAGPRPAGRRERETVALLVAQSRGLQARYDEGLQQATPLADAALDPTVRLRAAALLVNLHAATRDFLNGQKRLEPLLASVETSTDAALRRHVHLVASIFYGNLSQHDIARQYAERVLAEDPEPVEGCAAILQALDARLQVDVDRLAETDFVAANMACEAAGPLLRGFVDVRHARWWSDRGEARLAIQILQARMPDIEDTGYAPLLAEANAQLADSLRRAGRLDEADAAADAALALSAQLPTGLTLLQAKRTRYETALERGDADRALRELQGVIAAERAYFDEVQRLQEAYHAGRSESLARQQSLALLNERNRQLELQSEEARWATTRLHLVLGVAGVIALAALVWAWHSRRLKQRHQRLMRIDTLTGLWTRPHFTTQATTVLAAAESQAQPMALVLFDLDHFSQVNSRFGHLSGDRLLSAVGQCLKAMETPGLHFGRLGGEEFAVLLPGSGLDEGLAFAERCREAIAGVRTAAIDGTTRLEITASFGVVSTTAAGYRLRDLLANADQALYRAKNAGRNRVAAAVVVPVAPDGADAIA